MRLIAKLAISAAAGAALILGTSGAASAADTPDRSWSITGANVQWVDRVTGEDADMLAINDTRSDGHSAYVKVQHPNGTYRGKDSGGADGNNWDWDVVMGHGAGAIYETFYLPNLPEGKSMKVTLCLSDGWSVIESTCSSPVTITE